jgi:hypothetical protein
MGADDAAAAKRNSAFWRELAAARLIHHARRITLRLPQGDQILAEVLSRLRELPDPA